MKELNAEMARRGDNSVSRRPTLDMTSNSMNGIVSQVDQTLNNTQNQQPNYGGVPVPSDKLLYYRDVAQIREKLKPEDFENFDGHK